MSNILVGDLKNMSNDTEKIKLIDFNGFEIKLKTYLPMAEKIGLVASVYNSAISRQDELQVINQNALDIAYKVLFIKKYTDISLPKNNMAAYDLIEELGLFKHVYIELPRDEKESLKCVLDNFIAQKQEEYKRKHSAFYLMNNLLNTIIDKIPSEDEMKEFVSKAGAEIDNFDPEKLNFVKDFMSWNSGDVKDGKSS